MIPYQLRPYTNADFDFVYRVKTEAFKGYVEKFWGVWAEDKQRGFFANFIEKFQNSLLIIEHNETPIGIYHGELIDQDTYEIGNIIIVPAYQRQGIGKDILQNIIKAHPNKKMRLRVFKGNPAIALYKRLGFAVADESQTHYFMELRFV